MIFCDLVTLPLWLGNVVPYALRLSAICQAFQLEVFCCSRFARPLRHIYYAQLQFQFESDKRQQQLQQFMKIMQSGETRARIESDSSRVAPELLPESQSSDSSYGNCCCDSLITQLTPSKQLREAVSAKCTINSDKTHA